MTKKYLPFIVLLAAALLLFYIKKNQRGSLPRPTPVDITVPAVNEQSFNRKITKLVYSKHARCRMDCRHIDETEVREILQEGTINYSKVEEDSKGKTFPLEGKTHDNQHVRIVFAPKQDEMVVVTVIDLDTNWSCQCNER